MLLNVLLTGYLFELFDLEEVSGAPLQRSCGRLSLDFLE